MQNTPEEKFLTVIDVFVVGVFCAVLQEYLNSTWDLVNQQTGRE